MIEEQRGRYRDALDVVERAVAVCREIPEHRALAHALGLRCAVLSMLGQLEEAEHSGAEAVELLKEHRLTGIFSTVPLVAYADLQVMLLQRSDQRKGALARRAARAVRQALKQGQRVRDEGAVESKRVAGHLKFLFGDEKGADRDWAEGLRISEELHTVPSRARILEVRGRMCMRPTDLAEARRLFDQCELASGPEEHLAA